MDTRRLSESIVTAQPAPAPAQPASAAVQSDGAVEVVELSAVERPRLGILPRVAFVVAIAIMAGVIAWAGLPARSSFAFDTPLPNILQATPAP